MTSNNVSDAPALPDLLMQQRPLDAAARLGFFNGRVEDPPDEGTKIVDEFYSPNA